MTSAWPDLDWHVEMTPVDFVSNSIVKLTKELQISVHKIFHIIQANDVTGRLVYRYSNSSQKSNFLLVFLQYGRIGPEWRSV